MATTTSPFLSINWKDFFDGLAFSVVTTIVLPILTSIQAGQFNIDWTKEWQLGVSAIAGYILKALFTGPSQTATTNTK
jgi:hypothetical protein